MDFKWQCQANGPISDLPVQVDCNLDGLPELIAPVRAEAELHVFSRDGSPVSLIRRNAPIVSVIAAGINGPWAIEETSGRITIFTCPGNVESASLMLPGTPLPNGGIIFTDINQDGKPELLCARQNGIVTAFDIRLAPIWQYDSGLALQTHPVAAPAFSVSCAILLRSAGTLQAVSGGGRPLWQFTTQGAPQVTASVPPLVVQLAEERPSILFLQGNRLYALDIIKGREQWRADVPDGVGAPAVVDYSPVDGRRIVLATPDGKILILDSAGNLIREFSLPPDTYDPSPLISDVDDDEQWEILTAARSGAVVAVTFDGKEKQRLQMPGPPGLMSLRKNSAGPFFDLICTASKTLACINSKGFDGWMHPFGGDSRAGALAPLSRDALPLQEKSTRRAKLEDVIATRYYDKDPFALAVARVKLPQKARFVSILIKNSGTVVGGAYKRADKDGISVPFIYSSPGPLSVDVCIINATGGTIASSTNVPVRARTVKLIELPPLERLVGAIQGCAQAYLRDSSVAQPPRTGICVSAHIGGYCTPAAMAAARGQANVAGSAFEAILSSVEVTQAASPSASLARRLQLAALLGGASRVTDAQGLSRRENKFEFGIPYTPVALLTDADANSVAANPLFRYVFGSPGDLGLEQDILTAGPHGESFDIIRDLPAEGSHKYAVVWALGNQLIDRRRRHSLVDYVKQGGILVLHAQTAKQLSESFLGVQFTGRRKTAEQFQTPVANGSSPDEPFSYDEMECGANSQILAWTEEGDPVMSWRKTGKGLVVTIAISSDGDYSGNLPCIIPALLQILCDQFLPIQPPPEIQSFINRTQDGWVVGLLNNHGVIKGPFSPAVTDPREAREIVLKFQKSNPLQFDAILGDFAWDNFANGLATKIPPGEAAIVKLTMP